MKIRKLNKKGSHAGMMISFVIFISFLAFVYSTIEPSLRVNPSKTSLLEYLKNDMLLHAEGELITITATNTSVLAGENCAPINHSAFIESSEIPDSELNILAKNNGGNIIQSNNFFNNYTHVDISGGEEFIKIFYTTENLSLSEIPQQTYCQSNSAQEYAPSIAITKKIVFEKKLLSLFDRYNDSYLDLKEDFRIPKDTDFSFSFTFVNETNITTGDVEVLADVFVGEYLIPYLDSDANVVFGVLEIKLW